MQPTSTLEFTGNKMTISQLKESQNNAPVQFINYNSKNPLATSKLFFRCGSVTGFVSSKIESAADITAPVVSEVITERGKAWLLHNENTESVAFSL